MTAIFTGAVVLARKSLESVMIQKKNVQVIGNLILVLSKGNTVELGL